MLPFAPAGSELVRFFAIFREYRPTPFLPHFRIGIVENDLRIVLELECLEREEKFGVPERASEVGFVLIDVDSVLIILHMLFREIHRVNERGSDLPPEER